MTVPSLWVTSNIQQEQNPSLLFSTAEIWGSFVTMPYHVLTDTHGVLNTVPGSEELVAYGLNTCTRTAVSSVLSPTCPISQLSHQTQGSHSQLRARPFPLFHRQQNMLLGSPQLQSGPQRQRPEAQGPLGSGSRVA